MDTTHYQLCRSLRSTNASISNLIEDEYGNIWISTLKGIYLFNAFTKRTTKFDEEDGLQVRNSTKSRL